MSIEEKLDQLLREVGEIKAALAISNKPGEESLGVTVDEAMKLLRIHSRSAFYRFRSRTGLRPYVSGLYRRDDVLGAMLRGSSKRRAV